MQFCPLDQDQTLQQRPTGETLAGGLTESLSHSTIITPAWHSTWHVSSNLNRLAQACQSFFLSNETLACCAPVPWSHPEIRGALTGRALVACIGMVWAHAAVRHHQPMWCMCPYPAPGLLLSLPQDSMHAIKHVLSGALNMLSTPESSSRHCEDEGGGHQVCRRVRHCTGAFVLPRPGVIITKGYPRGPRARDGAARAPAMGTTQCCCSACHQQLCICM